MNTRLLLDTHVLVRWLVNHRQLSTEQRRTLDRARVRGELLGVSATTLVELAVLSSGRSSRLTVPLETLLEDLEPGGDFCILPINLEIAREVAALGDSLRDPGDRVIVATARIHGLRLITSDQRIIQSKLAPVVE